MKNTTHKTPKSLENQDNQNADDFYTIRSEIIRCTLHHAIFDGFGTESLQKGAIEAGYSVQFAKTLFPNPKKDVINHWAIMLDTDTTLYAATLPQNMKIREKISALVKYRITQIAPYKTCIQNIYGIMAVPTNTADAINALYNTANCMWCSIGDIQKQDYNYYTKRIILSAVLLASISFWIQDNDYQINTSQTNTSQTNAFIDARIKDALKLATLKDTMALDTLLKNMPFYTHPLKMRNEK